MRLRFSFRAVQNFTELWGFPAMCNLPQTIETRPALRGFCGCRDAAGKPHECKSCSCSLLT